MFVLKCLCTICGASKCLCIISSANSYVPSMVQTAIYHPWCKQLCTIHGTNSYVPSMVQTAIYHPWYNQLCTIHGANSYVPSMVQTAMYHPWCKQLCTIHGINTYMPSMVQTLVAQVYTTHDTGVFHGGRNTGVSNRLIVVLTQVCLLPAILTFLFSPLAQLPLFRRVPPFQAIQP